jgi:hypothetical protein
MKLNVMPNNSVNRTSASLRAAAAGYVQRWAYEEV